MSHFRILSLTLRDEPGHFPAIDGTLDNHLPEDNPGYRKASLRLEILPHGHTDLTLQAGCDGLTFRLPQSNLFPEDGCPVVAKWVSLEGSVFLQLDGRDVSDLLSLLTKTSVHTALTALAPSLGLNLFWEDEVDEIYDLPF